MAFAIIDSSVYIGHWTAGHFANTLEAVRQTYVIRHSAVVLSELRRGARGRAAQRVVEDLHQLAPMAWAPSATDWWEAGRLVLRIGDAQGWETSKRREFQNDALIALTACRYGAAVVTANRGDFELLARMLPLWVIYPRPSPGGPV